MTIPNLQFSPAGLKHARASFALFESLMNGLCADAPVQRELFAESQPLLCLIRNALESADVAETTRRAMPCLRLVK